MTEKNILQNWFVTGAKPTQEQFWAWQESYWHKGENIPTEKILGLSEVLANKADVEMLQHKANLDSSNLTGEHVLAWKEKLGVGELPTNIATIDEGNKQGNTYTKTKVNELLENSGKNLANSDLKISEGEARILDITGASLKFKGLPAVQGDASYRFRLKMKADGTLGMIDESGIIKSEILQMPQLLSETEHLQWMREMNGGWTTNTMSVGFINPPLMKKTNENIWITLRGANLNFNPAHFKIEILNEEDAVVGTVPNNQVQLQGSGLELILYYNFNHLDLGFYKLRLWNGVASYTTNQKIELVEDMEKIDFSNNIWNISTFGNIPNKNYKSTHNFIEYEADYDVKPHSGKDDSTIVFSALSSLKLPLSKDYFIQCEVLMNKFPDPTAAPFFYAGITTDEENHLLPSFLYHIRMNWGGYTWVSSTDKTVSNNVVPPNKVVINLVKRGGIISIITDNLTGRTTVDNIVVDQTENIKFKFLCANLSRDKKPVFKINSILKLSKKI